LAAGKDARFNLVYGPRDGRAVNGHITFHSNAVNQNLVIGVTGSAATAGLLIANPSAQTFGSVQVGATATLHQSLTNTSSHDVRISKVTALGSSFSVAGISTPLVLAPGHSVTFPLYFSPTATGKDSGWLSVTSDAKDSVLKIGECGTGTSSGIMSVFPTTLDFGKVAVGSKKTLSATLKATEASVTIRSASLSSNEYSLSGLTLPHTLSAGQSVSFNVIFAPKSGGAADASLRFATTSSKSVQASLQGTGVGGGSGHVVDLSWEASTSQVIGYNVYRGINSGGPYARINSSPEAGTVYADSSVQTGTKYYYVVTSVNNKGQESSYSNQASASVP
jgi:hypothetical protein